MPNINVNVTSRRSAEDSDHSYPSRDSQTSYESSSQTSPLDEPLPFRRKALPRSDPRDQSASRSRPASVRVEHIYEEETLGGQVATPLIIQGPAPDAPTARPQHEISPGSHDGSEEHEEDLRDRERERHHKRHHKKRHLRRPRSPSETTEEMDRQQGFVNEYGHWVPEHQPRPYPAPHEHIPPQHFHPPPSHHPGMPQHNNALVPMNPYGQQQAMYQQPGYPPHTPFYPQSMPQSPMGMMGMPPQGFFPWQMMGALQPPPSSPPPPAEPNDELLRLRAEDAARRAREQRIIEDAERAKREIEIEAARRKVEKAEREEQAKLHAAAVQQAIDDYKKLEADKVAQAKIVEDIKAEVKKTAEEAAAKKLKEKEEAHKKKLEEATQKASDAEKAKEAAEKDAAAAKGPPENDQKVHIELCAATMPKSKKFNIPFGISKSWKTLFPLLITAYEKEGTKLAVAMEEEQYDIVGPEGTTILPQYWDIVIKPDMDVKVTVRVPEPIQPQVQTIAQPRLSKSGKGLERTKSSKGKRRQSAVMFNEVPTEIMHGAAPPPPPPHMMGGAQMPDDIVFIEEDDSNEGSMVMVKNKKTKKPEKAPGMMDILFGRTGGKKTKK